MWNGQRNLVKDFRSCLDFWDIIINEYLITTLISYSGFNSLTEFRKDLIENSDASIRLFDKIHIFTNDLTIFDQINTIRKISSTTERDQIYENHFLFLQHALTLQNFILAMRQDDSRHIQMSLSYFTVWFQVIKQFNYATECLHLTIYLSKLWFDELVKFWMQNCLINPSGKKEDWMACDYLGEYIIHEIKNIMSFNINEVIGNMLRNKYSPQIMIFRDTWKIMQEETDAPIFDFHSLMMKIYKDVESVVKRLINEQFFKMRLNWFTGRWLWTSRSIYNEHWRIRQYSMNNWIYRKDIDIVGISKCRMDERIEEMEIESVDNIFLIEDDDDEGDQWL